MTDVLLAPHTAADPGRTAAVRGALTDAAAATPHSGLVVVEADPVMGPTGKVRKFLMWSRHRAQMGRVR